MLTFGVYWCRKEKVEGLNIIQNLAETNPQLIAEQAHDVIVALNNEVIDFLHIKYNIHI